MCMSPRQGGYVHTLPSYTSCMHAYDTWKQSVQHHEFQEKERKILDSKTGNKGQVYKILNSTIKPKRNQENKRKPR
jgi:hypothetical protein